MDIGTRLNILGYVIEIAMEDYKVNVYTFTMIHLSRCSVITRMGSIMEYIMNGMLMDRWLNSALMTMVRSKVYVYNGIAMAMRS